MLSEWIACNFVFHLVEVTRCSLRRQLFQLLFLTPLFSPSFVLNLLFPYFFAKQHQTGKQLKYVCVLVLTIFLILPLLVFSFLFYSSHAIDFSLFASSMQLYPKKKE